MLIKLASPNDNTGKEVARGCKHTKNYAMYCIWDYLNVPSFAHR